MPPDALPRVQRLLVMGVVLIAFWMAAIDSTITNLGFGTLAGGLNVTLDEVAWVSSSYALAMMTAMPLAGWLAGALGRKRAFILALTLFTAASFGCAVSTSLGAIVVARFVQGLGAGAMQPLASAALIEAFPEDQLGKAFRIIGIGGMVGPLTGPMLGGWILDNFPWPMMFLVNVPVGLVTLATAATVLPEARGFAERSRFDWGSLGLMSAGLIAFQYVMQRAPHDGLGTPKVFLAAIGTVLALGLFVRAQLRSTTPLVNLRPLRMPTFAAGTALGVVTGIGFTGTSFVVPLYFIQVLGWDATAAGLGVLPAAIATLVSIQLSSTRPLNRVPPVILASIGLICVAVGCTWMMVIGKSAGFNEIILPRIVQGIGNGLTYVPLNVLIMRGVPRQWLDGAGGLSGLMRQLGVTSGYALISGFLVHAQTAAQTEVRNRIHVGPAGDVLGLEPIRQFLMGRGFSPDDANAYAGSVFGALVSREASQWAYVQTFWMIALLFIGTLPVMALFWYTSRKAEHE